MYPAKVFVIIVQSSVTVVKFVKTVQKSARTVDIVKNAVKKMQQTKDVVTECVRKVRNGQVTIVSLENIVLILL